jgi:hypothetical protein
LFSLSISVLVAEVTKMPALTASTGILACAFTQFPYDTLTWARCSRSPPASRSSRRCWPWLCRVLAAPTSGLVVATALAGVGLTAVHPSVTIAAAVPAAFFLVQRWITIRRVPLADLRTLLLVAVIGGVTGVFQVLGILTAAGGATSAWPPGFTAWEAVDVGPGRRAPGVRARPDPAPGRPVRR